MAAENQLLIDIADLTGGVNQGDRPTSLKDNQFSVLRNFYIFGNKLIRRRGIYQLTKVAHTEALTSAFAFKSGAGVWHVVCGGLTGLARYDPATFTMIPVPSLMGVLSSTFPWTMRQYIDVGLAARVSAGTLKRFTPWLFMDAGIPAPATAPTLVEGAAGAIPNASFYGVVVFANKDTGCLGNPSPASAICTVAAGPSRIAWSNIPISTNGQVNQRRLFRTMPDQLGVYYRCGTIDDNVTTVFDDNSTVDGLGAAASFDNGLPPSNIILVEIWAERSFISDGERVYYSEQGLPECFAADSIITVYEDDGHPIRALHNWGAMNRLIIGKTNGIHYLTGVGLSSFELKTLSSQHGCFSPHSMQSVESVLMWYGGDDFYMSTGGPPVGFGSPRIQTVLDLIPDAQKDRVVATIYPALNWYVAVCPQTGLPPAVVVYNYKQDAWTVFDHTTATPSFISPVADSDYSRLLYSVDGNTGHLYEYHREGQLTDNGALIEAQWISKGYSQSHAKLGLRRLSIASTITQDVPGSASIYAEQSTLAEKTRIIQLYDPNGNRWRHYSLSNIRTPSDVLQVGLLYAQEAAWEIEGLSLDIMAFKRWRTY